MPKWAERAKAALGKETSQFQTRSLEETIEQASQVVEDIVFVLQSSDSDTNGVDISVSGLDKVESFYRESVRSGKSIELGADNFERLMGVLVGQYLAETNKASWTIYSGRHHVLDPVVIQLDDGKFVDVFMFCKSLAKKAGVSGAAEGRALSRFVGNVSKMSFP